MMAFRETSIHGVFTIDLDIKSDDRGWFARTFCKKEFEQIGFQDEFVQMNHSFNIRRGTFRGFHFQAPPHAETKLIRCVQGAVMDIALDLRKGSPTFLKTAQVELSARNARMIQIPPGVAHGFITTEDSSALIYHHTQYYSPQHERGIRHDDPRIRTSLSLPISVISQKDRSYELLPRNFEGIEVARS